MPLNRSLLEALAHDFPMPVSDRERRWLATVMPVAWAKSDECDVRRDPADNHLLCDNHRCPHKPISTEGT